MYYYISSDDDDHLPDLVLEPKSESKEPYVQTTPDNPIVIDSDSSDCESPPAKKASSQLIIPESQIPAVPHGEVQIVESPQQNNVKPDVPVPVQKKKVKFLLKEDDSKSVKKAVLMFCLIYHWIPYPKSPLTHQHQHHLTLIFF